MTRKFAFLDGRKERQFKMAKLAVNVDHVATIRQARGGVEPDPAAAAVMVELAGADGVVVHLREDRRHIQDRDARLVRQLVKTRMILEMAATDEMLAIAAEIKPQQATLVPERRQEVTTEGGLNVAAHENSVKKAVARLHEAGIEASLFLDPEPGAMRLARKVGADIVEIHTGAFCDAADKAAQARELKKISEAVRIAREEGLVVHAGHGIGYKTILDFAGMDGIAEFSIGHSIISRAVFSGLDRAVREMLELARMV